MRKGKWERNAWLAVLVLAVVTVFVEKGKQENDSYLSALSYAPSGTRIFVDLLRKEGVKVRVDRSMRPKLEKNDLVITAYGTELNEIHEVDDEGYIPEIPGASGAEEEEFEPEALSASLHYLRDHFKQGGVCLNFSVSRDFGAATQAASETAWMQSKGKATYRVTESSSRMNWPSDVVLYKLEGAKSIRVGAIPIHAGLFFSAGDSIGVTNRFIDKAENARFYVQLTKSLLPEGGTVVFAETSIGNTSDGTLLAAIGPWAQTAFQQFMLVLLAIALTLGRPFGPLIWRRREIQSKRDLMEAIGLLLFRGNKRDLAISVLQSEADRRLKLLARVPQRAPIETVWPILGPEIQSSYHAVFQSFSGATGLASEQAVDGLFQNIRWAERNRKGAQK